MALSRDQAISQYGTEAYTGWGEAEAAADARAKGITGGGSSGGSVDSILQNSINAITGAIPKQDIYENKNPFSFDEALARKAATAEYEPYYKRTLEDFTQSIQRKTTRSAEDLKSTLNFLAGSKEYFTGAQRRILDQSLRSTAEGYEGRGLYMSGASKRDLKDLQEENLAKSKEYERGYTEDIRTSTLADTRLSQDSAYDLAQTTRNIGEEQKFAIESGILKRKSEARETYEYGRKKYYANMGIA